MTPQDTAAPRVLWRTSPGPGENYDFGGRRDLEVGTTEVLAEMIAGLINCDVHRITAADPYPASYDGTVQRTVSEQNANARPAMADPLDAIATFDTVLPGSPIWNVRAPMIMSTFTDRYDPTGKTIHPFVTCALSGLGSLEDDYATACPGARIGPGLPVRDEEVPKHQADGEADGEAWLRAAGLLAR